MSEYNPFDIAPPVVEKPVEKPDPPAATVESMPAVQSTAAPTPPETDLRYAPAPSSGPVMPPPSAPYPSAPAAPGRAPLAGQPSASPGMPVPAARPPMPPSMPYASMPPPAAYAPPPPPSQQTAPPPPSGSVQYDLAGNPLPVQAPPPQAAPPPQMGMKYDLAGNPLPMSSAPPPPPQAPPGQYGYSQGNAGYAPPPPQGGGYGGGYQRPLPSTTTAPASIPAGMEEAMTGGANWMIGIVLLTLGGIWMNYLTYPLGFMPYISYAAISGVLNFTWLMAGAIHSYPTAAVLGSVGLIPLGLLGFLGYRRQAWVFVIAMVVYGLDIPVTILTWILHLSLWGIVLGTAWHSFIFQRMFAAWTAAREINATMAGYRS